MSELRKQIAKLLVRVRDAEEGFPRPIVDLGGGGARSWTSKVLGPEVPFKTWDLRKLKGVTRVVDACSMPQVEDGILGTILSISVLEHVWQPFLFAFEVSRVLRSEGILLVTTVFQFKYHPAPRDYWRFTPEALRTLFCQYFTEVECDWLNPGGVYFWGRKK